MGLQVTFAPLRPSSRFRAGGESGDEDVEPDPVVGYSGAGDGTRTRDPHLGKVVLYQLSYSRVQSDEYTMCHGVADGLVTCQGSHRVGAVMYPCQLRSSRPKGDNGNGMAVLTGLLVLKGGMAMRRLLLPVLALFAFKMLRKRRGRR